MQHVARGYGRNRRVSSQRDLSEQPGIGSYERLCKCQGNRAHDSIQDMPIRLDGESMFTE